MNSYLISVPLGDPAPTGVRHSAHTQDYNNGTEMRSLWDCINASDPTPGNAYLIGTWDMGTGDLLSPLHEDFFLVDVRPLGNAPEQIIRDEAGEPVDVIRAGLATETLRYAYWDTPGMKGRKLDQGGNLYPNANPPFLCECRLLENGIYGWFPRWEISMENGAEIGRDPSVRNVRVFSSADCIFPGEYQYTTGAFIYGDSAWHTDEEGAPLKVWWTKSDQFVQAGEPVHFAIYWGETENGRFTVPNELEPIVKLFWEDNITNTNQTGVLHAAWVSGSQPWYNVTMTAQERLDLKQALRDLGISQADINQCHALYDQVSHKSAFLRLLYCIENGIITLP